jgi:hypothetical protein
LRCDVEGSNLKIHLETVQGVVPSLEIYTADIRKTLLEDTLGVKVEFLADNVTNLSNATSGA